MKIVFAIQNQDEWKSVVSERFGRTELFVMYDEDTERFVYQSNAENVNVGHGAGVQAGQAVVSLGAEAVLTGGSIGPKAFDVLKAAGVKMYSQVGKISIEEAYRNFKDGKYPETLESDK